MQIIQLQSKFELDPLNRAELEIFENGGPEAAKAGRLWREFNDFESFRSWFLGWTTLLKVLPVIYKAIWTAGTNLEAKI